YQNIYFKGAAGVNILPEVVSTGSSGNDNTMEFDPGFALSGGIGVDIENDFRLEGEVIWATYSTLDQLVGSANGTQFSSTATEGSISSLAFMANAAYDFSNQGSYIPFVYGGVGMAGVFMNDITVDGTLISDSKDWVFAMQTGGGISIPIDPGTTLEASYRYFQTRNPEFGDERDQPFSSTLSSHSLMIGARLKF
ncbi:MAG: outer membrane beta-barrel protein, partial [Rhodospirillales bacterium]